MITFQNLENISMEAISDTMNLAFSDYSIPITFPVETLQQKFVTENIQPNLSVGAFNNDDLVGVILHGYNAKTNTIYNGGTGVIPNFRGQKFTQKMYDFASTLFKGKEIKKQQLEVIFDNIPAIKSYEKVGFTIVRKLNCYKGIIKELEINSDVITKEIDTVNWELIQSFWDVIPSWQNNNQAMQKSEQTITVLGAFLENKLVGYLIFNIRTNRIHQLAVDKNYRNLHIASTLCNYVKIHFSENIVIINVDENATATNTFLEKIGLINFLQQFEMEL